MPPGGSSTAQDIGGPVLGDDADDDPAHPLEHLQPPNVLDILPTVRSVMVAVVFDGDHVILPAQVEVRDRNAVGAQHGDLGLRPR